MLSPVGPRIIDPTVPTKQLLPTRHVWDTRRQSRRFLIREAGGFAEGRGALCTTRCCTRCRRIAHCTQLRTGIAGLRGVPLSSATEQGNGE